MLKVRIKTFSNGGAINILQENSINILQLSEALNKCIVY